MRPAAHTGPVFLYALFVELERQALDAIARRLLRKNKITDLGAKASGVVQVAPLKNAERSPAARTA